MITYGVGETFLLVGGDGRSDECKTTLSDLSKSTECWLGEAVWLLVNRTPAHPQTESFIHCFQNILQTST